jgi:hypothetical protein
LLKIKKIMAMNKNKTLVFRVLFVANGIVFSLIPGVSHGQDAGGAKVLKADVQGPATVTRPMQPAAAIPKPNAIQKPTIAVAKINKPQPISVQPPAHDGPKLIKAPATSQKSN